MHAFRLYAAHRGCAWWLLLWPFLRAGFSVRGAVGHWLRHDDPASLARIKRALGLLPGPDLGPLDARLLGPPPRAAPFAGRVTIIMPVFNALDVLREALARVVAHSDGDWHLIVVEDCSSDPRVRPWLRDWHAGMLSPMAARVEVIENEVNLGFTGAVNRALEIAVPRGDHVVLLNSDALVPPGWLGRLLAPIAADARVASVTPMSNDAEIFSVPMIRGRGALREGEAEAIDRVAARLPPEMVWAEVPTGVGFCMAMNVAFLRQVPQLDPAFGHGYGEEVDWCQRTRALGGRHVGTAALFVEHRGAASFGSEGRDRSRQVNGAILTRRYPRFDAEVHQFIRDDPLRTARLALALAQVGARREVPVILAHSMGGGAERVLTGQIEAELARGNAALVLRVGGARRWRVELHGADGIAGGETDDAALVRRLVDILPARRIIYSCGAGDPDPVELPGFLYGLASRAEDRIEVLVHDYLPVSPSWNLLDHDTRYRGPPRADETDDPAHVAHRPDGTSVPLAHWQAEWGGLLDRAEQVTVFSEDSRAIMAAVYPAVAGRITVAPHRVDAASPVPVPEGKPVIGVLGNIGPAKGAAVVQALARRLARRSDARLVVIGNIDPSFPLPRGTRVHGSYAPGAIPALVARYGITCWLIPSIWPETFSLTTHEALATGLPVWCFDLGAQADAVRAAGGQGGILPLPRGDPDADAILAALLPAAHRAATVDPDLALA